MVNNLLTIELNIWIKSKMNNAVARIIQFDGIKSKYKFISIEEIKLPKILAKEFSVLPKGTQFFAVAEYIGLNPPRNDGRPKELFSKTKMIRIVFLRPMDKEEEYHHFDIRFARWIKWQKMMTNLI